MSIEMIKSKAKEQTLVHGDGCKEQKAIKTEWISMYLPLLDILVLPLYKCS